SGSLAMSGPPVELGFTAVLAATAAEIRERIVRSVVGDGTTGEGTLEVLDNGPSRFASRFRLGDIDQLRVAEWSAPDRANGAVEHSIAGRVRLSSRYEIRLRPAGRRLVIDVTYYLSTPYRGLELSLRYGRRRALVRRLAKSWLPIVEEKGWEQIHVRRGPRPASELDPA
ncbi:MAG: hypothetical protein L3J91_07225, partial [Thermoplasmata archaeon]|nr:hypothetical protein [Thermoplasmata archaeon]